jgi:hypothetical protein
MGLLGDVRREVGLTGAVFERVEERSASFALGGNGTARGDGVGGGLLEANKGCGEARWGMGGDRGELGDGLGDFATRRNFDGDRERERRSDLTALATS